ncbi:helix-turn-helix transcriptional regulator [Microbacterium resistens]
MDDSDLPSLRQVGRAMSALSASGRLAAPHVVAWILHHAHGDMRHAVQLASTLGTEQVTGERMLPFALPPVDEAVRDLRDKLSALSSADLRVLRTAALSTSHHTDVVLAAAAIDLDSFLTGPANGLLTFHGNGRFEFTNSHIRSVLIHDTDAPTALATHRALARAATVRGEDLASAWHWSHVRPTDRADLQMLQTVAVSALEAGSPFAAFHAAARVCGRANGELAGRAALVAGHAALLCGATLSAREYLSAAFAGSANGVRERASTLLVAVDNLTDGPVDDPDPRRRIVDQIRALVPVAASAGDRARMADLVAITETWWSDPGEADNIQARSYLATTRARPGWPWNLSPGGLSPLIEALALLQQCGFQLQVQDYPGAASLIRDVLLRLPAVHVGAGTITSAVRLLTAELPDLGAGIRTSLHALSPRRPVTYEPYGSAVGERSSAAARAVQRPGGTRSDLMDWRSTLSRRELQVASHLLEGKPNDEIGRLLGISPRTVEVHLTQVYRKLAVRGRAEFLSTTLGS